MHLAEMGEPDVVVIDPDLAGMNRANSAASLPCGAAYSPAAV